MTTSENKPLSFYGIILANVLQESGTPVIYHAKFQTKFLHM